MAEGALSFGRFRLDLNRRELFRDQDSVRLGSRALDILCVLASARGALVTKDALMEQVWPGVVVEENDIQVHVSALRKALDAEGGDRSFIVTVPGRGYRLVGSEDIPRVADVLPPAPALAIPDKPSIAVLPFENLSGDPEQEYFVDGMVEEIITALSRIRWLFVIARNSSFIYKGKATDMKQVGRDLGVRYVLEGSVRKGGNRVRITAQLIEAETGMHLWADRFDGSLADVFELQDNVASGVAGVIEPALQAAETMRSRHRPTTNLTAYDLYLLGHAKALSSAGVPEALDLMEQAIGRDPEYGPALAGAAICCMRLIIGGRSKDPATDARKGANFARRSLDAIGDDAGVLANAALALAHFGEDIDAMMTLADRAVALHPSFARGWQISGVLRLRAGQLDTAIEHVEMALRLSPRARVGNSYYTIGMAHLFATRFEAAATKLLLAIQDDSSFPQPYRALAACFAHMGQLDHAQEIIARLRAISPVMIPDASHFRNSEHRELFLSGLRLAVDG
jgi:TolB-like protein/tetratricopeptide (TPR) repeat protein